MQPRKVQGSGGRSSVRDTGGPGGSAPRVYSGCLGGSAARGSLNYAANRSSQNPGFNFLDAPSERFFDFVCELSGSAVREISLLVHLASITYDVMIPDLLPLE